MKKNKWVAISIQTGRMDHVDDIAERGVSLQNLHSNLYGLHMFKCFHMPQKRYESTHTFKQRNHGNNQETRFTYSEACNCPTIAWAIGTLRKHMRKSNWTPFQLRYIGVKIEKRIETTTNSP